MKKKEVILVDDEEILTQTLSKKLKKIFPELKFNVFHHRQAFFDHLAHLKNKDEILFAIVDKNLDGDYAGIDISEKLNEIKVHHILLSSEEPESQEYMALRNNLYCINYFMKTSIAFVLFQLQKAINDAMQHEKKVTAIKNSHKRNLAIGAVIGRYGISEKEAVSTIARKASEQSKSELAFGQEFLNIIENERKIMFDK